VKRALAASFLLAATLVHAAPPSDELVVAEWISTGAQAEHMVLPRLRSVIEYLRVDPANQSRTSAVHLLDERLVKTRTTMRSISDSLRTFEKGLVTAPSREFCEQIIAALAQAGLQVDSALMVVADLKRDTTLIDTRGQDLSRPFQALNRISWNTEVQRAKVLEAAERIRAARK
jgi:hypothetical protein